VKRKCGKADILRSPYIVILTLYFSYNFQEIWLRRKVANWGKDRKPYCKSKLERKSNSSEILPLNCNCKFICDSSPT